ncbi:MAG: DUF2721 domain-containing protein [Methanofollis sp.]|uniref:DUF2721 domain-containing protein n=1 Tax=Methanofollis sp. TaxID=2052835 RepID=UPI00260B4154|nr:DUF2721 domain-containing protein [Methanofollis sp.]MDD4254543.1 DUF2721 domain-containing protein [Methanofollis sp.]
MTTADIIQTMLAPGLMISACGLLLLGMNNKYSLVLNRIRLLDEEKRRCSRCGDDAAGHRESVCIQLAELGVRARRERNAILSYSASVAAFVVTSLLIGLSDVQGLPALSLLTILSFLVGMVLVLAGVLFAAQEALMGYEIICIDMKDG